MRKLLALLLLISASAFAQKKNIQPSQLPENALTFIETNFTSVALHHCMKFTEGEKVRFKAVLADDTEIDFNEEGKWQEVDGKVHSVQPSFLGQTIIAQIKEKAPGQRLLKATNLGKTIDVTLVNGQKFTFDSTGKFVE